MNNTTRDIQNYFSSLMSTHDPERAATLVSMLYKIPEKEVLEICKETVDQFTWPHRPREEKKK